MSLTSQLGRPDARPGNIRLGAASALGSDPAAAPMAWCATRHHDERLDPSRRAFLRASFAARLPGSWSIEPSLTPEAISLDKFHVPLAEPPRPAESKRDRRHTAARGQLGDVERPDAVDPFPGSRPVWHTPLSRPPRNASFKRDNRYAFPTHFRGEPPAPEAVSLDRFAGSLALPPARPRPRPKVEEYAIDVSHLGDVEEVRGAAFDATMTHAVTARPSAPRLPGSEILDPSLIPESPIATDMPPWHVALTAAPPRLRTRGRREFFPDGSLVLTDAQTVEAVSADKFHVPMAIPHPCRKPTAPGLPPGGIDLAPGQRLEVLFVDAFGQALGLPPDLRRRVLDLAKPELVGDATIAAEAPHADAVLRQDVAVPRRELSRGSVQHIDTTWIIDANFEYPLIVRLRVSMLAGGLWRARG